MDWRSGTCPGLQEQGQGSWRSSLHLLDSRDGDRDRGFHQGQEGWADCAPAPLWAPGGLPQGPENLLPFLTISSPHAADGTPASLGKSSPAPGAVFPGSSCPRFTGDGHECGTAQVTWSPM